MEVKTKKLVIHAKLGAIGGGGARNEFDKKDVEYTVTRTHILTRNEVDERIDSQSCSTKAEYDPL
ncbi:hypothetical protein BCM02_112250 [Paenibacillus methanolicus]|uniref:Uncharacterized protein n=1 Tax=Paenibacillus methanolicus TaxID=582686 RepID=A0A5S5BVT7_9BACL|nr:hypothetical protein BCM02_112250 [Paenibacillus methanolicus]